MQLFQEVVSALKAPSYRMNENLIQSFRSGNTFIGQSGRASLEGFTLRPMSSLTWNVYHVTSGESLPSVWNSVFEAVK